MAQAIYKLRGLHGGLLNTNTQKHCVHSQVKRISKHRTCITLVPYHQSAYPIMAHITGPMPAVAFNLQQIRWTCPCS